jgi:hypothetical protein
MYQHSKFKLSHFGRVRQLCDWSQTGCMSCAGSPRKSALGKVGAPTEKMKDKRAEAKTAEHQDPDRYDEEPLKDKCGHAPAQRE